MIDNIWEVVKDNSLRQGDYLTQVYVPTFDKDLLLSIKKQGENKASDQSGIMPDFRIWRYDLIILTQSCDFEQSKCKWVTLCPVFGLEYFFTEYPQFKSIAKWGEISKGRIKGYFVVASNEDPTDVDKVLIVDFRQIFTLPLDFVTEYAASLNNRLRLCSPYVEDLSSKFGNLFMRVATPDNPWGTSKPTLLSSPSTS